MKGCPFWARGMMGKYGSREWGKLSKSYYFCGMKTNAMKRKKRIAVFASGNGSNAENLIRHFSNSDEAEVTLVVCNRREAGVYERAERLGVPAHYLPKSKFNDPEAIIPLLEKEGIDFIVLAGFLLMIPSFLTERYAGKMVNIHPSLLPKYGGPGMYGHHVHEAVLAAGEKETGITIHYVTEVCDGGAPIFQAKVDISDLTTAEEIESEIHKLEKHHFPTVVESLVLALNNK